MWLIFFLFLQTKPSFCLMFAWSQPDFSAIPVSISAVSLTSSQTWQTVNCKRRLQRIQNVQEGKRHQKKETSSCFFLCSFWFWGVVSDSWILNDIGRIFSLGNWKKIAKCLMRIFTCRSTFLYGGRDETWDAEKKGCFKLRIKEPEKGPKNVVVQSRDS